MTDDVTTPDLFDTGDAGGDTGQQFEQMLDRLEEIVRLMEDGGLTLADSLKLFEEGAAHMKTLNTMLTDVRETVLKLVADNDGVMELDEFTQEETS